MPFWLRLTVGYIVLATILVAAFGFDLQTGINLLLLLVPFLTSLIRHLPRVYLFVQRLRYLITNRETVWRLSIEFQGTFNGERIRGLVHEIVQEDPKENSLLRSAADHHVFRYRRTVTVGVDLIRMDVAVPDEVGELGQTLAISILDQKVSYRGSKRMIEGILVPFFERLRDELRPDHGKFSMNVPFEGPNPFFGLYIEQMDLKQVREFTFVFSIPLANPGDYVRVEKTDMTLVSSSLDGFRRAAMTCLAFTPPTRS